MAFPSEDESRGIVSLGWRGPRYEEKREWVALKLLWRYLTESEVSPLQKAFVECDEPLCTSVDLRKQRFERVSVTRTP